MEARDEGRKRMSNRGSIVSGFQRETEEGRKGEERESKVLKSDGMNELEG